MAIKIVKARVGECIIDNADEVKFQLQFKEEGRNNYNGFSVDVFETEELANEALKMHNEGTRVYHVHSHLGCMKSYFMCKAENAPMVEKVNQLILAVKAGNRPSFTGVYLNEFQIEEMRAYVDDTYYNNVLKARLKPCKYIVCIRGQRLSFLRDGEGDPPRTLVRHRAKIFTTREKAEKAIVMAKLTHPYREREYFVDEL